MYFEKARRLKESRSKIVPIVEEYVVDQTKLHNAFETLSELDPVIPDRIIEYFENLDEEEYEYVMTRKNELSLETQNILWPDVLLVGMKSKIKVVEMTDQMYDEMRRKEKRLLNKKLEELVSKELIPERPPSEIDSMLQKFGEKLIESEKSLEDFLKNNKPKAYVPPAMRQAMIDSDPKVVQMRNMIKNIKNEINSIQINIEKLNEAWRDDKRHEIKQKLELEMHQL